MRSTDDPRLRRRVTPLIDKLQTRLRHHRQRVFAQNGDAHTRAIARLKRTATFAVMCAIHDDRAAERADARLAGMG